MANKSPFTDVSDEPVESTTIAAPEKKKRAPRKKTAPTKLDSESLSSSIQALHAMLALKLSIPELALDKPHSDALAAAVDDVMKEFEFEVNPKIRAIGNLMLVSSAIYYPMFKAVTAKKREEKENGNEHAKNPANG